MKCFSLINVFSWFAADWQIQFMDCSKFSLLFLYPPRYFTWDTTLIFLKPAFEISFLWPCFLLSIFIAWKFVYDNFAFIKPIQGSHSDSKDTITSSIHFPKLARVSSPAKKRKTLKNKINVCPWRAFFNE